MIARGAHGLAVQWDEAGKIHPSMNRLWHGLPEADPAGAITLVESREPPTGAPIEPSSDVYAGEIRGWVDARGAGFLGGHYKGVTDFESGELRVHVGDTEPFFEPTFILLAMTAQARGWTHLHAASVRLRDGRRALLVGTTHAGKSTSMIALASHGARWGSDDAVFVQRSGDALRTVSLPRSFLVRPPTIEAFPSVKRSMWLEETSNGPRQLVDPTLLFDTEPEFAWQDIDVLLLPRVADQEDTTLHRVDGAEAMTTCLPNCPWGALEHLPKQREALAVIAAISSKPAYAMQLGRRVLTAPESLADAIESATG